MENNTNQWINWEDTQSDTPQQPQTSENLNWGESEDPQTSENLNGAELDKVTFSENTSKTPEDEPQLFLDNDEILPFKAYSKLGSVNKIQINTDLYTLGFNTNELINELSTLSPTSLDEKGRYSVDFSQGEQLNNVILILQQIASLYNSKLKSCFIYRIASGDKLLNIFKGKPNNSFIYYLQADQNSCHVINDLSSIGGPSISQSDPSEGILNVFPGWVPYSLSENNSDGEMIAIAGTFE